MFNNLNFLLISYLINTNFLLIRQIFNYLMNYYYILYFVIFRLLYNLIMNEQDYSKINMYSRIVSTAGYFTLLFLSPLISIGFFVGGIVMSYKRLDCDMKKNLVFAILGIIFSIIIFIYTIITNLI